MKLFVILNREIKSGMAINALAQMSLGLGHRLSDRPDINIFLGTSEQVKDFKRIASRIVQQNPMSTLYSAFPLTMEGGDMEALKDRVINTPEEEVVYCGSCFVAPEIDHRFEVLLSECLQFENYKPYISDAVVEELLPEQEGLNDKADGHKKTTTLINHKVPLAQTLNQIVLANLNVGRAANYDDLHLLTLGPLTHISYNTHPVVQPKEIKKLNQMAKNASESTILVSATEADEAGQPLVTVTFGDRGAVESVILKAQTRIFDSNFEKAGFVPAIVPSAERAIVPCAERAAHQNHFEGAILKRTISNSSLLFFAEQEVLKQWAMTTTRENNMTEFGEAEEVKGDRSARCDF